MRAMSTFEDKRQQRVRRIREVALQLFAETGYEKTTIRLIAREAQMALGLLYNYYPGKEELLADIYRGWQQQLLVSLQTEPEGTPRNAVSAYIQKRIQLVKANRPLWKLIFGLRMQSPVLRQLEVETETGQRAVQQQLEACLMEAGIAFPGLEAKLLFATMDGLVQHYLHHDNWPIDDMGNLLLMKYREQGARPELI
jgi:AcrR family transcriptional regulator